MIFFIYGFFVPEGHMIVARRFIAGFGSTGTASRRDTRIPARSTSQGPGPISNVPPGRDQILNINTSLRSSPPNYHYHYHYHYPYLIIAVLLRSKVRATLTMITIPKMLCWK
jgi:hypothetical protein